MAEQHKNGSLNFQPPVYYWVYFAQAEIENKPMIKIGFWNGRNKRSKSLSFTYKSKFLFLCAIPGGKAKEKELHLKFKRWQRDIHFLYFKSTGEQVSFVAREFFLPSKKIIEFIESIKKDDKAIANMSNLIF